MRRQVTPVGQWSEFQSSCLTICESDGNLGHMTREVLRASLDAAYEISGLDTITISVGLKGALSESDVDQYPAHRRPGRGEGDYGS